MAEQATPVAERWERSARNGGKVDANSEMVGLALRVVGRAIFGDDVASRLAVKEHELLQRFQIGSVQERVPLDTQGITLRPKGAVPIHLRGRGDRAT